MPRRRVFSALHPLAAALVLAACGGGGGSGAPRSHLFIGGGDYGSDQLAGLRAVDPADPTTTLVIEPETTEIRFPRLFQAGTWGGTSGRISEVRTGALVYAKEVGETGEVRLFRVDARATGTAPVPVPLGSLQVSGDSLCSVQALGDHGDLETNHVLVTVGAEDGCFVGSDPRTLLPMSAGESDAGVELPADRDVLGAVRAEATGAIEGWLAQGPGGIYFEAPDFAAASEVFLAEGTGSVVVEWAGRTWLEVSGELRFYDAAAGELGAPPGAPVSWLDPIWSTDGAALYYGSSGASPVSALPLDGATAPVEIFVVPAGDGLSDVRVSAGRVLVRHDTPPVEGSPVPIPTLTWTSVPKAGGAPVTLSTGSVEELIVAGDRVYLQPAFLGLSNPAIIREDGEQGTTLDVQGSWVVVGGDVVRMGTSRAENPRYLLLSVDPIDPDGEGGPEPATAAGLRGYDGPSGQLLADLGSFTLGDGSVQALVEGSGPFTLLGTDSEAGLSVYFVKADEAGSLVRVVAEGATFDQRFVGTSSSSVSCASGGATGAWALALALLGLGRMLRRSVRRPG